MKHHFYSTLAIAVIAGSLLSTAAMAQDTTGTTAPVVNPGGANVPASDDPAKIPGHPRINQVDKRLENQQDRINKGVADGQINAKQESRDETSLQNKEQKLSADEAKNGGHITKAEQKSLNKGLNKNSKRIHRQRKAGRKDKQK